MYLPLQKIIAGLAGIIISSDLNQPVSFFITTAAEQWAFEYQ
jgi:hypothetical protein